MTKWAKVDVAGPVTLLGTNNGHLFGYVPAFVDLKKAPGASPIPAATLGGWVTDVLTLKHVWGSPNGLWAVIAVVLYALFPYDLSTGSVAAAGPFTLAFFMQREFSAVSVYVLSEKILGSISGCTDAG